MSTTLNCPVKKVRWMKSRASGFVRFWRFKWVFFIMVCYSEALLVKTGLVDVPEVLWTAYWGIHFVQVAQCADSSPGWGLSSGTGGHELALALCIMAGGIVVPARWPELRDTAGADDSDDPSTDCEDVKAQGVLCSGSLPGGTRSSCASVAAPW